MRAKFKCESITLFEASSTPNEEYINSQVKLRAVHANGSEENDNFNKWTPSGSLELSITNPAAKDFFVPGKFYYLDLTPVPIT